jgi:hypothetical protein
MRHIPQILLTVTSLALGWFIGENQRLRVERDAASAEQAISQQAAEQLFATLEQRE